MQKKIIVIIGSPRENSNSEQLADRFIEGATSSGHDVTKFIIREHSISGCNGCDYCYENNGECMIHDDMDELYSLLYSCDTLVIATPIYYQSFPSQLKSVIDRFLVAHLKSFSIHDIVFLATYSSKGRSSVRYAEKYFKVFSRYMKWDLKDIVSVGELDDPGSYIDDKILNKVRKLGADI